jgi:hypothetical protein
MHSCCWWVGNLHEGVANGFYVDDLQGGATAAYSRSPADTMQHFSTKQGTTAEKWRASMNWLMRLLHKRLSVTNSNSQHPWKSKEATHLRQVLSNTAAYNVWRCAFTSKLHKTTIAGPVAAASADSVARHVSAELRHQAFRLAVTAGTIPWCFAAAAAPSCLLLLRCRSWWH